MIFVAGCMLISGDEMTEEQRKEMISREFLRILANSHGFKIVEPPLDHGVDMIVCPVTERVLPNGHTRYLDSQYKLDFQIKSTTNAGVVDGDDDIRFDLESKNYNDLVARRDDDLPLHLVLVVLDGAPPACVEINNEKLALLGRAFWYLPDFGSTPSANVATVRVSIPKANILGANFVRGCYVNLGIPV